MTSIQQLRGDLTSSGDQPSTNLATYFKVGLEFRVTKKQTKLGTIIVADSHVVLSIELHCGPNSGCREASGDPWRDIQSKVRPGCRPPLRGARQTGMESKENE